ncbi:hypothetical protein GCM10010503_12180 [Streptomyces lucensis JCM 4490]|uniref:Secreted protein n=1 Tax=Streptomyces lucensis JCM 4490 TaxID=1306176 RepID=A0A918IYX5_9ACTN|nr:hypothetical protein [Streptomyces lucensis]GGW37710.1 hypothetical protein GCM10010503_12180 [Streptomyces lucensis JCM 4490]
MRKLHQVALIVAAAGGLSAVGAGPSFAAPATHNGSAPPPASQQDTHAASAASAASSQATTQGYGSSQQQASSQQASSRQAAPQRGTEVAPQVNPQLNPQLSPQLSQAPKTEEVVSATQTNLFRPYQECSPQTLLDANVPVGLLGAAETHGVECTQANSQSNSLSQH